MTKPYAITLDVGSSLVNHTGSWRTRRPIYVDRLPPCNNACPAGENIQAWLFHAEEGNYRAAWEEIVTNNPLPAIIGRVCYHNCESACNRGGVDESVGIHTVERFLGDMANREGWKAKIIGKASGKKVLIVGSGPSGLSCAYHLARLGHQVTIYEAAAKSGGMLRYGIPQYRLPRETLDADIKRILDMGVELKLNTRVEDILQTKADGGFDAVYLAVGAHVGRGLDIPVRGNSHIVDAARFLRSLEEDEPMNLGKRVAIYGGGNTAMDVARSAIRMGATEVNVITRGPREKMAAHSFEIKESLEEGAKLLNQRMVRQFDVDTIMLEKTSFNEEGALVGTGEIEMIEADSLVLAIGQMVDLAPMEQLDGIGIEDGVVKIGTDMNTGIEGIYAGGDMVPSPRTVTTGIGHGKKAARYIDAYLNGAAYEHPGKPEVAELDKLNTWYYSDAPKTVQPTLELVRRQSGFEEVLGDLDESNALFEARRCFSCGNCFECDTCYGVCPDNAVIKLGPGNRFEFNYDYCKGCGICATECPCGAIKMEAEAN